MIPFDLFLLLSIFIKGPIEAREGKSGLVNTAFIVEH
jgi:hypothetical protein